MSACARRPGARFVCRIGLFLILLLALPGSAAKGTNSTKRKKPAKPRTKVVSKAKRLQNVKQAQSKYAKIWYAQLQESLTRFPADVVKGRVIVIDPGHVACSPGAEGPKRRITEADLNWQVARHLEKLLVAAGARVVLTKSYAPPIPPAERKIETDLDQRAAVANRERADLFISIHHNWTSNPAVNKLEVYYKLDDRGASLDAANYIMIHMARNLSLDGVVLSANFRVLRVNERPALLTEACYMSNPIQESLLTIPENQVLEAQSIYLGILDYFSHGVPEFELITQTDDIIAVSRPQLRIRIRDRSPVDRATVRATFDGVAGTVEYLAAESICIVRPTQPLANGKHTFRFEARNLAGNAGIPFTTSFTTDREPARIALNATPSYCPTGIAAEIRATVYDRDGLPVADTRKVRFVLDQQQLGDSALHSGSTRIYIRRDKPGKVTVAALCGKAQAATTCTFGSVKSPVIQFRVLRNDNGALLSRVAVRDDWRTDTLLTNLDGILTLMPPPGSHIFTFELPGYRTRTLDLKLTNKTVLPREVRLEPMLGGALLGARIMLDPAGRNETPDTTTELGGFNLALAQKLGNLLQQSGAVVQLARQDTTAVPRTERLIRAGAFKPDLYLRLAARTRDPVRVSTVGHYPNSPIGTAAATAIGARLAAIRQLAKVGVGEDRLYEITNAPCPAVGFNLRFADTSSSRLLADSTLDNDLAREILLGLALQHGARLNCTLKLKVTNPARKPIPSALVVVDDLLRYRTDAKGDLVLPALDSGTHVIVITAPGHARHTSTAVLSPAAATFKAISLPARP